MRVQTNQNFPRRSLRAISACPIFASAISTSSAPHCPSFSVHGCLPMCFCASFELGPSTQHANILQHTCASATQHAESSVMTCTLALTGPGPFSSVHIKRCTCSLPARTQRHRGVPVQEARSEPHLHYIHLTRELRACCCVFDRLLEPPVVCVSFALAHRGFPAMIFGWLRPVISRALASSPRRLKLHLIPSGVTRCHVTYSCGSLGKSCRGSKCHGTVTLSSSYRRFTHCNIRVALWVAGSCAARGRR